MRNKQIAKGLRLIAEGFTTLANAYEEGAVEEITTPVMEQMTLVPEVAEEPKQEVVKEAPVQEPVKEEAPEVKEEKNLDVPLTEEGLNSLAYNDLKVKAKELGVKAVGSKQTIIENILLALNTPTGDSEAVVEEKELEDLEDVTPVVEDATEPTEDVVPDEAVMVDTTEEEDEEDVEADPEGEQSLYDQVVADLEGYTDEELADILSSIGVSPKGKRQALLAKIVQAIEDGQLEWEEESEEASTPEPQPKPEVEEVTEDLDEQEDDFVGTEARKHACLEECDRIELAVGRKELSHKEIINFLKEYNNGRYVSQGEDADIEEYMAIHCDLIDDEGVKHELADPYYVGDDICCCGRILKEVNDDLYCEICGTEYEK